LLQEETVDQKRGFAAANVLRDAVRLLLGLQHLPRPMGHLSRGGDLRQAHNTGRLWRLAGDARRPLMPRDLQALPQRFDDAGLLQAGPSRASLRVLLDDNLHLVRGALQRPPLGRCRLGISTTAILLLGRLAHGGLQCRRRGLQLAPQVLLPPLILAAGVHDHGAIGLALSGDATLGHLRKSPRTVLCRGRRCQYSDLLPSVLGHGLRHAPPTCALGGGYTGDEQGISEGREIVLRHEGGSSHVPISPLLHPIACQEVGDLG
jgi:hypothetical protein